MVRTAGRTALAITTCITYGNVSDNSPASVYSSEAEVLYDEDLADNDRIAVLQAQVARLQTDQRDQRLALEGAFLKDPSIDSDD